MFDHFQHRAAFVYLLASKRGTFPVIGAYCCPYVPYDEGELKKIIVLLYS